MQSIREDPPQSIKLGVGAEMKTIVEEPVQNTGECCCCRNTNYHGTNTTSHGANGVNNTQASNAVPDNQVSVLVPTPITPTGDSTIPNTCRECNKPIGVTATITTRKKVNNNYNNTNNLNTDASRRQRYESALLSLIRSILYLFNSPIYHSFFNILIATL